MAGNIYTKDKCTICGGPLKHDPQRRGCFCPAHKKAPKGTSFEVIFPGGIHRRFQDYIDAEQFLNHIRVEKANRKDKFNPDDYRAAKPNSFAALAPKYLDRKRGLASYGKIEFMINHALPTLGHINVREITGADIEDYLFSIDGISEKTRHNHMAQLRNFWNWCLRRGNIITLAEMPNFPEVPYELGRRKITDWETQELVLEKVRELTAELDPKIAFAIDMLATYTALRPDDLRRVTESSLDESGWLIIHNPTKRKNKFKTIRLLERHVETWRALQFQFPALPDVPFFRHAKGQHGIKAGSLYGDRYLWKWWMRACDEVGLEGVPLYPGTKHTTATETAKLLGKDDARKASGLTNKAFDRYCDVQDSGAFDVVTAAERARKKKAEVLPFKRAIKRQ